MKPDCIYISRLPSAMQTSTVKLSMLMTPIGGTPNERRYFTLIGYGENERVALHILLKQVDALYQWVDSSYGFETPLSNRWLLRYAKKWIEACLLAEKIPYDTDPQSYDPPYAPGFPFHPQGPLR